MVDVGATQATVVVARFHAAGFGPVPGQTYEVRGQAPIEV
jgi:phage tail tape-measure protein